MKQKASPSNSLKSAQIQPAQSCRLQNEILIEEEEVKIPQIQYVPAPDKEPDQEKAVND